MNKMVHFAIDNIDGNNKNPINKHKKIHKLFQNPSLKD